MIEECRTILLAEHNKSILDILTYLLNAWDYKVIVAADGMSVLDIVSREHPDIIIIDSNLPKISGLELSKSLKEDFLTSHIPIIILIDRKQIRKKMLEIEQGVDDYIANPPDPIDLEVRLEMALRRSVHQLHANALTRLPGNRQIEKIIKTKLEEDDAFSVAYYDIDNFKSFNDKYGYMKGDNVIRHAAYVITTTVKRSGNKTDFVGHIGGDDFVVITTPDRERLIASESILIFNRLMPFHYNREDRQRGSIINKDRRGNVSHTPLMSISIAIANNREREFRNIVELIEIITEVKRYLKTLPGSNFLVNRRGIEKKEAAYAEPYITQEKPVIQPKKEFIHKPLGQILVESSVLTVEQLELALNKHWNTGQKIGQSIIDLGMASQGDVVRALEAQLNVPHFDIRSLAKNGELGNIIHKIPFDVMKHHSMVPVNKDKDVVSLAMVNPKDIIAIDKIKSFTGLNVAPFFVLESEFNELWGKIIKKADKGD
ncbi:MAG: diguanylate cyclase [Candidatus Omnitrophica bacterium]|nr:diguanylate cyclase [Candidatus Omnitrophota bacterium]